MARAASGVLLLAGRLSSVAAALIAHQSRRDIAETKVVDRCRIASLSGVSRRTRAFAGGAGG
jgi:hypothetical protein